MARSSTAARPAPLRKTRLLVSTRKGLWTLTGDIARNGWRLAGPQFLGHIVHHSIVDPRDGKNCLAAARTGHLGPTIFRSTDNGRTWKEATRPPAFAEGSGRVVDHTFWLTPGHASEPGVWYAGTSPQGLFRSADGGATWEGVAGFNAHPDRKAWCGGDQDGTPDGPKLHSILIDPRNPAHMYFGMSSGGVFETNDAGAQWRPLNKGVRADFLPDPTPEFGHDPHCVRFAGGNPGSALSAESLRDLPARPTRRHVARHRGGNAEIRGVCRLAACGACARSGHAVGAAHGWHECVAANRARRPTGRLSFARRRQDMEAPGSGNAEGAGVVDGEAPGDDHRRSRANRHLLRHDVG